MDFSDRRTSRAMGKGDAPTSPGPPEPLTPLHEEKTKFLGNGFQIMGGSSTNEPIQTRTPFLIILQGGLPGEMFELFSGKIILGRALDCPIHLGEKSVSRHHAELNVDPAGLAAILDKHSANGTFINGRRLAPWTETSLQDGDQIQFGSITVAKYIRLIQEENSFHHNLFERSIRDRLTGLHNRAYFFNRFTNLCYQAAMQNYGTALAMIDIDHFKEINDQYGHAVGDDVLRRISLVLKEYMKSLGPNLSARFGGEEFLAAYPAQNLAFATEIAEDLRSTVSQITLEATRPDSSSISPSPSEIQWTISIGLTFAPLVTPHPVDVMVTAADVCLYQAKSAGRNKVIAYELNGAAETA